MAKTGLEVWFREDIENSLLAVYAAMITTAANVSEDKPQSAAYRRGFEDALKCIATSFGFRRLVQGITSLPERTEPPYLQP